MRLLYSVEFEQREYSGAWTNTAWWATYRVYYFVDFEIFRRCIARRPIP